MSIERTIWAISIFGQREQKGLVEIRLDEKRIQMTVKEAKDHAFSILEAAEAAETDEFLVKFCEKIGIGGDNKFGVLSEFRKWRDQKKRENKKSESY